MATVGLMSYILLLVQGLNRLSSRGGASDGRGMAENAEASLLRFNFLGPCRLCQEQLTVSEEILRSKREIG